MMILPHDEEKEKEKEEERNKNMRGMAFPRTGMAFPRNVYFRFMHAEQFNYLKFILEN